MSQDHARAPLKIAACRPARHLAGAVAAELGLPLVPVDEVWFSCGEGKFIFNENVRGSDLYLFQAPVAPGDPRSLYDRTMMLLHAIEAAVLADAREVTAVVPYFPGARQDKRKGRTREGISAGLVARCLDAAGARRVVSLEIHNEAIAGMFNPRRCRLENLVLHTAFSAWLRETDLHGQVVAAPDVGGLERARAYAEDLDQGLVVLSKERDYSTPNRVATATLIGDVAGKDVLLVDDIVDTAGSVVAAIDQLKQGGARHITVACAHALFSGPALDRLQAVHQQAQAEQWRFAVVGTNAVHHEALPSWYTSYDIAPLLARVIRSIHDGNSVTLAHTPPA
jgi:ribose-phosphate pyrophosphokinase